MENEFNLKRRRTLSEIWADFKQSLKTPQGRKKFVVFMFFFILVLLTGLTIYDRYFTKDSIFSSKDKSILPILTEEEKNKEKKAISHLDGQLYGESTANRHPMAIMVENHPDARPQTGLDKAKVIYEAITEGGITRFMAVFGPESVSKVGPVRSARSYFLDWALEFDAFYAHVGGSSDALALIPQIGIKDLNQFRYGTEAFWRVSESGRATEHTMYTDTDKLWAIAAKNKWDMNSSFDPLQFKDQASDAQRPESQSVVVNFSTDTYKVEWKYNKKDNFYERYLAGKEHKDRESGKILTAKNIIIQETQRWEVSAVEGKSGWAMKTVGEGKAKIVMDGKMIEGKWKKEKRSSRTYFYDLEGNKIKFNPGVFWYEIVPPGTVITNS